DGRAPTRGRAVPDRPIDVVPPALDAAPCRQGAGLVVAAGRDRQSPVQSDDIDRDAAVCLSAVAELADLAGAPALDSAPHYKGAGVIAASVDRNHSALEARDIDRCAAVGRRA